MLGRSGLLSVWGRALGWCCLHVGYDWRMGTDRRFGYRRFTGFGYFSSGRWTPCWSELEVTRCCFSTSYRNYWTRTLKILLDRWKNYRWGCQPWPSCQKSLSWVPMPAFLIVLQSICFHFAQIVHAAKTMACLRFALKWRPIRLRQVRLMKVRVFALSSARGHCCILPFWFLSISWKVLEPRFLRRSYQMK